MYFQHTHPYFLKLIFFFSLVFLATPSIAGLFDKKISTSISYEIIDEELKPVDTLSPLIKNSLLSLEAGLRGTKNKTIKKSLGVNLVGKDIYAMQESIKNLQVTNVLLDSIPSSNTFVN